MICRSWSYKGPSRKECTNISLSIRNWWSPDWGNNVHIFQWPKYEQKYGHYCLKKFSFLTHIIVGKGDWLWKPANIKVENNGSVKFMFKASWPCTILWRSGESTPLPLMWPRFNSRLWSHAWVEFVVGSLPFSERFFLWVIRFSPLLNNQLFQIPFRFGRHGPFSTSSLDLLSAPWVNKLHAWFSRQIMTKEINAMFPLVTNFKMIRMLLNVVHASHVQKSKQKVI